MSSAPSHPHRGDGDGWVECDLGHRHWGRFGAAGLLLRRRVGDIDEVLLQHRAPWSHHGDTWGLLGGARNSTENPVVAALREADEEGGLDAGAVHVHGRFDEVHGGWSYVTVLADAREGLTAHPTSPESVALSWVAVDGVTGQPLHPGFARAWPKLRDALRPVTLVVDAANVVGSRPDGWWRDREGAARRLVEACAALARDGIDGVHSLTGLGRPRLEHWWPHVTVVVEGAARGATDSHAQGVRVVAAPAAGDDSIVSEVADAARTTGPVVVVTADRELRARCAEHGAVAVGPRWLTDLTG